MEMLGHIANAVGRFAWRLTENINAASIWHQQAKHQFEQCSLAPSIRSEKGDEISRPHCKVHFLQNRNGVERKPEVSDLYDGIVH